MPAPSTHSLVGCGTRALMFNFTPPLCMHSWCQLCTTTLGIQLFPAVYHHSMAVLSPLELGCLSSVGPPVCVPVNLTLTPTRGISYLIGWDRAPDAVGAGVAGPWVEPSIGKTWPFRETESEILEGTGSLEVLGRDLAAAGCFPCKSSPRINICLARLELSVRPAHAGNGQLNTEYEGHI